LVMNPPFPENWLPNRRLSRNLLHVIRPITFRAPMPVKADPGWSRQWILKSACAASRSGSLQSFAFHFEMVSFQNFFAFLFLNHPECQVMQECCSFSGKLLRIEKRSAGIRLIKYYKNIKRKHRSVFLNRWVVAHI